jgi:hypothetical protein
MSATGYMQVFTGLDNNGNITPSGYNPLTDTSTFLNVDAINGFSGSVDTNGVFDGTPFFTIDKGVAGGGYGVVGYCSNCSTLASGTEPIVTNITGTNPQVNINSKILVSPATGSVYLSGESNVTVGGIAVRRLGIRQVATINSSGQITSNWSNYGYANGESAYAGISGFPSNGPATTTSIGGAYGGATSSYIDNVTSNRYAVFSDPNTAPAGKATLTGLILINK